MIATNPLGVEQARAEGERAGGAETFQGVTDGLPEEVSLLAYLDLRGLLSLGEEIGLATDPALRDVRAGRCARSRPAALAVTDADEDASAPTSASPSASRRRPRSTPRRSAANSIPGLPNGRANAATAKEARYTR